MKMKSYFSVSELAGLPGLPTTSRAISRMSKRLNWHYRKRIGRGGGREYLIDCFPAITQKALAVKYKVKAAKKAHAEVGNELPKTFFITVDGKVFEVRAL